MMRKSIGTTKLNGLNGVCLRTFHYLDQPLYLQGHQKTQCRRLTLRQKATSSEVSICTMTIGTCHSISASSQLLCLTSIRLIDLDLPIPGSDIAPPSPHTAVRCVQPVSQDVKRINHKGRGLTRQSPKGGSEDVGKSSCHAAGMGWELEGDPKTASRHDFVED